MNNEVDSEYGKVRVYKKTKKRMPVVPEAERTHPVHTPYKREKHSVVIDGLGDDFYDDE